MSPPLRKSVRMEPCQPILPSRALERGERAGGEGETPELAELLDVFGVGLVVGRGRAGDELGEAQFLRLGQRRSGARAQTERREHVPDPVHDVVEERFAGFGASEDAPSPPSNGSVSASPLEGLRRCLKTSPSLMVARAATSET